MLTEISSSNSLSPDQMPILIVCSGPSMPDCLYMCILYTNSDDPGNICMVVSLSEYINFVSFTVLMCSYFIFQS